MEMRRRRRYSARPFALTILVVSIISLIAYAKSGYGRSSQSTIVGSLSKRDSPMGDLEVRITRFDGLVVIADLAVLRSVD